MSKSLYTPADVRKVREELYEEQKGLDLVTGEPVEFKDTVTDHDHKTQYVRGVIHRQINAFIGKLENNYIRFIGWWYKGTLPELLRKIADYLDRKSDTRYIHPKWIKKVQTEFAKLNSVQKTTVLAKFTDEVGTNDTQRKKIFKKLLTSKANIGYDSIIEQIESSRRLL